jgi:F0F1-type ATP synthase assembly protein I
VSERATDLPGQEWDPATQPKRPERSLGELFAEMTSEVSTLFRQEVQLAKTEAKDEASRAAKGVGMFAGAGVAAWMAVLFVSLALAWLLDQAMNTALAFLVVGLIWVFAAAVLALVGKSRIKSVEPLPTTVQTIKEDVEWAKQQKS